MFYADIRALPKVSLNVNAIRYMIDEYQPEDDDCSDCSERSESWEDAKAQAVTREMEHAIAVKLASCHEIRFHDIFLEAVMKVNEKPSAA